MDSSRGFAVAPNLHLVPRSGGLEDQPAPSHLPPAPQTPLDLIRNTGLQATLGPKNKTFNTLALSATGLIEQEGPLIGALSRVCAGLRGEGYEFRWVGDEARRDELEEERKREVEQEKEEQLEREEQRLANEEEEDRVRAEEIAKEERDEQERKVAQAEEAAQKAAEEAAALGQAEAAAAAEVAVAEEGAAAEPMEVDAAPAADAADSVPVENGVASATEAPVEGAVNGTDAAAAPTEDADAAPAAEGPVDASAEGEAATNGAAEEAPVPEAEEGESVENVDSQNEEPPRRSGRRVASRLADPGPSSESDEEGSEELIADSASQQQLANGPAVADEELPEYARRIVDPEVYVRSLFVSEGNVEMPAMTPLGGMPPQPGAVDVLSPNEQEVMVHDCLTDLHRFLADSVEYRERLAEIRDGVLGIERRRKGMWKVLRMVTLDWLQEEEEALYAQQERQD